MIALETDSVLEEVIAERAQFRGGMQDRAISEFGKFVTATRKYLTYGKTGKGFEDFLDVIDRDEYNPNHIEDYLTLFAMYDAWSRKEFAESEAGKQLQQEIEEYLEKSQGER